LAVIFSGYLVYQSLSKIVGSIHKEARPDFKLLQIKDIAADLTKIENTVRLYTLTRDEKYLHPYKQVNQTIQERLSYLQDYALTSEDEKLMLDSIGSLTNEKLLIWEKILALHRVREDASDSFSELYSRIDSSRTEPAEPDTVMAEVESAEEKQGLLRKIFGGKKRKTEVIEQVQPPADTNIIQKETIKQEIAEIEQRMLDTRKALSNREKELLEQNIELTKLLNIQINFLEEKEKKKLLLKTEDADRQAAITYKRLALFTIASVIFLLMVLFLFYRYLNQSRTYQTILSRAKTEAEKLAKAKELFVATVSHEMRTPINAIYGLTEQLIKSTDDKKTRTDLEIIHRSTEHLISLVNDTLDFSKIETQKMELNHVDFSLKKLLDEVVTLNQNNASAKQLELKLETMFHPSLVLLGDAFRLKQVLINLINNAIKFTDEGSIVLQVYTLEKDDDNVWAIFKVIDSGIGISKENFKLIFEDFVQLETDLSKKQKGAGLGLSIVKKLIDIQGGNISVDSELNRGTTITAQIPYKNGDPQRIKKIVRKELAIPAKFKDLSFLIVDDEDFNRYLLRNILTKWGAQVSECVNGQEAVDLCKTKTYDAIFMDVRMPVLNGLEASRQILRETTENKIIALTASNKTEDIDQCKSAGMNNFLSKPFSEQELFDVLQKTLDTKMETKKTTAKVDLSELKHMSNGDPKFVREMVEIFIRSSESGVKSIRKNLQSKDWKLIGESAHKMAAPAKHMRVDSLYSTIKEIEHEADKTQNGEKIKRLFADLETEVEITNNRLKGMLKEL
jgi:signal transduction histidine kinase/CheY-like chemotaxis protein